MAVKRRFDLLPSLATESFVERPFEHVPNLAGRKRSIAWHLTAHPFDQLIQRGQVRMNLRDPHVRCSLQQFGSQHFIQNQPERINVCSMVDESIRPLLVRRLPTQSLPQGRSPFEDFRKILGTPRQ